MATIIRFDGTKEEIRPKNGKDFKFPEVSDIVGGNIKILFLENKECMIVNYDGYKKQLRDNLTATQIAFGDIDPMNLLYGDVLVCKEEEIL